MDETMSSKPKPTSKCKKGPFSTPLSRGKVPTTPPSGAQVPKAGVQFSATPPSRAQFPATPPSGAQVPTACTSQSKQR